MKIFVLAFAIIGKEALKTVSANQAAIINPISRYDIINFAVQVQR